VHRGERERTYEEGNVEPVAIQLEFLDEALDASVGDIDAVKERKSIDDEEDRIDVAINLPAQASSGGCVDHAIGNIRVRITWHMAILDVGISRDIDVVGVVGGDLFLVVGDGVIVVSSTSLIGEILNGAIFGQLPDNRGCHLHQSILYRYLLLFDDGFVCSSEETFYEIA
jgi:hypothetical protein